MLTRFYKDTKTRISTLGLGCMRLPLQEGSDYIIDEKQAEEIVDYAYMHGINYFDTAYVYHNGLSEVFIGKALKKYPRESYYLADKMPGWVLKEKADAERVFNEQLERCGVDYFDFYLCHSLSAEGFKIYEKDEYDVLNMLDKKKKEGKIRRLGFSFHDTPEALANIIDKYPWDFVQIQLNYLDWEISRADELYDIIEKHGMQAIIMEPVRGGTLATLSESSAKLLEAANPNASLASWAIRFAASLPNVLTVLSGMSNMAQIEDNVNTMTDFVEISESERVLLKDAVRIYKENVTVPCTGCRYCTDCPQTVAIPEIFALYNEFALNGNGEILKNKYSEIEKDRNAGKCVKCGLCQGHCPQHIEIPKILAEIAKKVASL